MTEVDRYNRTALQVADLHEYSNIVDILKKHLDIPEQQEDSFYLDLTPWQDFYPGIKKGKRYLLPLIILVIILKVRLFVHVKIRIGLQKNIYIESNIKLGRNTLITIKTRIKINCKRLNA